MQRYIVGRLCPHHRNINQIYKYMKKILLLFAAAICAVASWAQSTVSATVSGQEVAVSLSNAGEAFVAFQMDINLPEGVDVAAESGAVTIATERLTQPGTASDIDASETIDFKVLYKQNGRVLRVIAYNLENREIVGEAGKLFTVALSAAPAQASDVNVSNIKFVTKSALAEVELPTVDAETGLHPYDVNRSGGEPDIDDAIAILEYCLIVGAPYKAEYDLNYDTHSDIDDAIIILTYLVTSH